MNIRKSFLPALLFIGIAGMSAPALSTDGVILKEKQTTNYCHLKFPGIREDTLNWKHPVLQSADSGDIVDFYGPCDESPVSSDQVDLQRDLRFTRHARRLD